MFSKISQLLVHAWFLYCWLNCMLITNCKEGGQHTSLLHICQGSHSVVDYIRVSHSQLSVGWSVSQAGQLLAWKVQGLPCVLLRHGPELGPAHTHVSLQWARIQGISGWAHAVRCHWSFLMWGIRSSHAQEVHWVSKLSESLSSSSRVLMVQYI